MPGTKKKDTSAKKQSGTKAAAQPAEKSRSRSTKSSTKQAEAQVQTDTQNIVENPPEKVYVPQSASEQMLAGGTEPDNTKIAMPSERNQQ